MEGFVRWRHICRVGSVLREFSESNLWCWSIWIALGLKWKSSARLSSVQRVEGWRRGDFFFLADSCVQTKLHVIECCQAGGKSWDDGRGGRVSK